MADTPAWQRRFTAPQMGFPAWIDSAPDHLAFVSNESGSWQVWATDLVSGERRRLTDEPVGVEEALVAPDGRVVWWRDDTGDETGRWMSVDFDGARARPLVPDLPTGWRQGISFAAGGAVALGLSTRTDYRAYLRARGWHSDAAAGREDRRSVWEASSRWVRVDSPPMASLVCLRHSEHGDIVHEALRVVDAAGGTVGEQIDEGSNLDPVAWSPVAGDHRLLFTSERGPFERPAIWDLTTGERQDLEVDLPGAVIPVGWWPGGSAILARHEFEGTDQLRAGGRRVAVGDARMRSAGRDPRCRGQT